MPLAILTECCHTAVVDACFSWPFSCSTCNLGSNYGCQYAQGGALVVALPQGLAAWATRVSRPSDEGAE